MNTEKIDINNWEKRKDAALEASVSAHAEYNEAGKIEELHARVAARTIARQHIDDANRELDDLQEQWGNCWRDQDGKIVPGSDMKIVY